MFHNKLISEIATFVELYLHYFASLNKRLHGTQKAKFTMPIIFTILSVPDGIVQGQNEDLCKHLVYQKFILIIYPNLFIIK